MSERVKIMNPGKRKFSANMPPGKPKCRCIYTAYDVSCDKDAAEGNEYCAEKIEPQCARETGHSPPSLLFSII